MEKLQEQVKYLFIDRESEYYKQAVELRYNEFFVGFNRPKETLFDEFENESIQVVACLNGKVIGHTRLFVKDSEGEISQAVIDKNYSGLQLGINMMTTLLAYADKEKLKRIELDARMYAIEFYRSLGFETFGEVFISKKSALPHMKMQRFLKEN